MFFKTARYFYLHGKSGVPVSNTRTRTFLKIIIHTTVLLSLLFANVCCTIDALKKNFNRGLKVHLQLIELPKEIMKGPDVIFKLLELASRRIFHFGIPLIFSIEFYTLLNGGMRFWTALKNRPRDAAYLQCPCLSW